jgi:hypothetical protein
MRFGRRFNTKKFATYEDARKHVRRVVTKLAGRYHDDFSWFGFTITK